VWHHRRAHRLFSDASWSGDALGLALADLIVGRLLPADPALTTAVDDTLFKRSGRKAFGAAWHHGGAARGRKLIGFGNCCVVAGIVVQLSFLPRPVCARPGGAATAHRKIEQARVPADLIAARHSHRRVDVVGDTPPTWGTPARYGRLDHLTGIACLRFYAIAERSFRGSVPLCETCSDDVPLVCLIPATTWFASIG
jgi:DDE superfamily endonuclease